VTLFVLNPILFPKVVEAAGISQVQRFWTTIPISLAFGISAWFCSERLTGVRGRARRWAVTGAIAVAAALCTGAMAHGQRTSSFGAIVLNRPTQLILFYSLQGVLAAMVLVVAWSVVRRLRQRRNMTDRPAPRGMEAAEEWNGNVHVRSLSPHTLIVVLAAALPLLKGFWTTVDAHAKATAAGPVSVRGGLANVPPRLQRIVRSLPPGSVVAAPADTSFYLSSIAPVYVVSASPVQEADTNANRIFPRYKLLLQLEYNDHTTDATRLAILRSQHAALFVVDDQHKPIVRFARRHPDVLHPVSRVPLYRVYRVHFPA
jgi:hypothetical protein